MMVLAALAGLALVVGLGAYFILARGSEIGRVAIGDSPSELVLHVPAHTRVKLWTEVDVWVPVKTRSYQMMSDLPHVVDYAIVVEQTGDVVAQLTCNPFQSTFTDWSSKGGTRTKTRWRYVGRLDECEVVVPSDDPVTVRVRRSWIEEGGARFDKCDLIARR